MELPVKDAVSTGLIVESRAGVKQQEIKLMEYIARKNLLGTTNPLQEMLTVAFGADCDASSEHGEEPGAVYTDGVDTFELSPCTRAPED
jgi:hypothetical protein